jgi:hypothetical protein
MTTALITGASSGIGAVYVPFSHAVIGPLSDQVP